MFEGTIFNVPISILIDYEAIESFASSHILDKLPQKLDTMKEKWNVEFASGQICKVTQFLVDVRVSFACCTLALLRGYPRAGLVEANSGQY